MTKNIIIAILVLIVIAESGYFVVKKVTTKVENEMTQTFQKAMPPAGPNARGGRQMILGKGANLKTSPLYSFAYQIAPGNLSETAKKALNGWDIKTQNNLDGSTTVTLTPKDSDDQSQQYIVKQGNTLYFIEQTPIDDKADSDKDLNYRDDYGIITDQNGIIQ